MKKLVVLLVFLGAILSCFIPNYVTEAQGNIVNVATIYVDSNGKGSVVVDCSYSGNYMSITSDDNSIATAFYDKKTKKITFTGRNKSGNTFVTLRFGSNDNYTDYVYDVYTLGAFDNVTFSYNYDKITVNYDESSIPDGCKPVFSIDGSNWSESNTLTRDKKHDGEIYKAYKVNGVVTNGAYPLRFMTKSRTNRSEISKDISLIKNNTLSIKTDINTDEYKYDGYEISSNNALSYDGDISFDEKNFTIYGSKTGTVRLDIKVHNKSDFDTEGKYTINAISYIFYINIVNEDGSVDNNDPIGLNPGSEKSSNIDFSDPSEMDVCEWRHDSKGWWYEIQNGICSSYPINEWKYIDNYWYYFGSDGYMESGCYRDGCWLNSDGSWNTTYSNGSWKSDSIGWWYDDNGWYPTGQWLKIDGYWYYFKSDGYIATNQYIDGYWLGTDGALK